MKFSKRSAFGVTALGAVAAGAASIAAAPAANAFVLSTSLASGPYCVGHTYALKVTVDLTSDLLPVKFTDNATTVSQTPGLFATSTTFQWTPTTTGNHTLVVQQDLINTTVGTVTVGSCTTTTTTPAPTTTTTAAPTTTTTTAGATTTTSAGTTTTTSSGDTGSATGILGNILSGLSSALPSGSAL